MKKTFTTFIIVVIAITILSVCLVNAEEWIRPYNYFTELTLNGTSIYDWNDISTTNASNGSSFVYSDYFNQYLNTTSNVTFNDINANYLEIDSMFIDNDLGVNGNTTIQDNLAVNDASGFHMTYKLNSAISAKSYISSGQGTLRLYDYLESKYADIGLGGSGTDRFLNIYVDGTLMQQIHKQNSLTRAYSALTSSRYYQYGADYGKGINAYDMAMKYSYTTCRGTTLSLNPSGEYTTLIAGDSSNCDATLIAMTSSGESAVFNIKNVDDIYNITIYTTGSDKIDNIYNSTNGYLLEPWESVQLHAVDVSHQLTYVIIGEVKK